MPFLPYRSPEPTQDMFAPQHVITEMFQPCSKSPFSTSEVPVMLSVPIHTVRVREAPPEQKMCPYASCKSRAVMVIQPKRRKSNSVGRRVRSMYDQSAVLLQPPPLRMRCSATSSAKQAVAPPPAESVVREGLPR